MKENKMNKIKDNERKQYILEFVKYSLLVIFLIPLFAQNEAISDKKKKEIINISKLSSKGPNAAPDQEKEGEGKGPYKRLVIRGGTVIDGTGGPPTRTNGYCY